MASEGFGHEQHARDVLFFGRQEVSPKRGLEGSPRYANEGIKPLPPKQATESEDGILMGNRTPYGEACERLAALQPPLKEYWVLRVAKRLGWIKEVTERLADLNEKSLGILLVGWTDLVAAARREEAGVHEDAPPQAA